MHCTIVPPYLLHRIADLQEESLLPAITAARHALRDIEPLHRTRRIIPELPLPPQAPMQPADPNRTIADARNTETLPGVTVRTEGSAEAGDEAVNETYEHLGAGYRLLAEVYGRLSMDGRGMALNATVHYGQSYENAFWNGSRMVLGDGDGVIFGPFTRSLTVIAHELAHGFTQFSTDLLYRGQSGALNESISDVFGVLTEQHHLGQDAGAASWLIGADLFMDSVNGAALRSLKAPGTAYNDPRLGEDPQPATMAGYVHTSEDNGGVHINSGIPNHAFYLTASRLAGPAWERAGRIWYNAVVDGGLPADCDFARFAQRTTAAAVDLFGSESDEAAAVAEAWRQVGVIPAVSAGAGT